MNPPQTLPPKKTSRPKKSRKSWKFRHAAASPQPTIDARACAEAKSQNVASRQRAQNVAARQHKKSGEVGGPKGLEPTRYGDWESAGRCIDF